MRIKILLKERQHLAGNERRERSNCVVMKGALRRSGDVCQQDAGVPSFAK